MNDGTDAGFSRSERLMLRAGRVVVPACERLDWMRAWQAELWYLHHPHLGAPVGGCRPRLTLGLLLDAVWLRTDWCRRALRGTAIACLLALAGACCFAALAGYFFAGSFAGFRSHFILFLMEAPLVVFVTFATTSRRHIHDGSSLRLGHRARGQLFLLVKSGLTLTLGFLASVDLAQTTQAALPLAYDLIQTFLCVVFMISGLRWAILDQQRRCKQCLLALALPSRVGRPSHNLLEWNGTQEMCRKGHGVLSSPEMESSWCSHSRWVEPEREQQMFA